MNTRRWMYGVLAASLLIALPMQARKKTKKNVEQVTQELQDQMDPGEDNDLTLGDLLDEGDEQRIDALDDAPSDMQQMVQEGEEELSVGSKEIEAGAEGAQEIDLDSDDDIFQEPDEAFKADEESVQESIDSELDEAADELMESEDQEALGDEDEFLDEDHESDELDTEPTKKEEDIEDDAIVEGFLKSQERHDTMGAPIVPAADLTFDVAKKRQDVIDLVTKAARELDGEALDTACNRFTHTKEFIKGDLYIFVFDVNGTCLAHGDDANRLWQNMINEVDWVGTPFVKQIIKKAKNGGGWVTYGWNNGTKVSYVKLVEKEGRSYVVGSGYYPHSKEEAVVNLVKGAVALFKKIKKQGQPADWAFSRISYPGGRFVAGNLYLYALDFEGKIVAQGERPGLIGANAWDYKDEEGLYVNREIVKKLKVSSEGVWVDYVSKRAVKRAYAEKVSDKEGNEYFIACGYYPDANRKEVVNLVRKGYQLMKTTGKSNATEEFTQRRNNDYRYGDLFLIVYDTKGKVVADGGNADRIGRKMYNAKDEDGAYYIQSILKRASKGGVWVNAKIGGTFQSTYAQKVDLGVSQYVITCSYYPVSKPETMMLLVQSGASYLKVNSREETFSQFVKRSGRFRRGDLQLVAVDTSGLCYAYGDDVDLIWRNIIDVKDEKDRPFIKMFINEVQQGPAILKTMLNNAAKLNYVTMVDKDGRTYVISSGYYP